MSKLSEEIPGCVSDSMRQTIEEVSRLIKAGSPLLVLADEGRGKHFIAQGAFRLLGREPEIINCGRLDELDYWHFVTKTSVVPRPIVFDDIHLLRQRMAPKPFLSHFLKTTEHLVVATALGGERVNPEVLVAFEHRYFL